MKKLSPQNFSDLTAGKIAGEPPWADSGRERSAEADEQKIFEEAIKKKNIELQKAFDELEKVHLASLNIMEDLEMHRRELEESRSELRLLADHLQTVREEERAEISREIHDQLGQALTGLKIDVSWILGKLSKPKTDLPREELASKMRLMTRFIDETIQTVRRISSDLRPGILDDLGLAAAIEWQGQEFAERNSLGCRLNVTRKKLDLNPKVSTAVFRIFQEILTNVARHAKATRIDVRLEREKNDLVLEVKDDGRGIGPRKATESKSLGLLGMRERALSFGGKIEIEGAEGKGTTVRLTLPYPTPPPKGNSAISS